MDAAAGCLKYIGGQVMPGRNQTPIHRWKARKAEIRILIVARAHLAGDKVAKQLRPALLGISHHDGIGMRLGVLGHQGNVGTAEHDLDVSLAKPAGQLVAPGRGAGDYRYSHKIAIQIRGNVADPFVDQDQTMFDFARDQGCERRQRQRRVAQRALEDAAPMPVEGTFG